MKKHFFLLFVLITILFSNGLLNSQVPEVISYQCYIKDQNNTPLNGVYALNFSLYDKVDATQKLWNEVMDVAFANGYANVYLGQLSPLSNLDFSKQYWLGIAINGSQEFQPRTPLASVPYAMIAKTVDASSGAEGNVLTIVKGEARWAPAGGLLKLPFIGSVDSTGPAIQIYQVGRGSAGLFSRTVTPRNSANFKNVDKPLGVDSNYQKPVLEVKEEHKKKENDTLASLTSAIFGAQGGFAFIPFLKNEKLDDSPLNIANYSGTKTVGFFCLDSVFGVDRYQEIDADLPSALYVRNLSRFGTAAQFYNDNEQNANAPAVFIRNRGLSNALNVHNFNNTNEFPAVSIRNTNLSNTLNILQDNPNNDRSAVHIENNGTQFNLWLTAKGNGGGLFIRQENPNASGKACLTIENYGQHNTAQFITDNTLSAAAIVGIRGNHIGKLLVVENNNTNNDSTALQVTAESKGPASRFYINNQNNAAVCVVGNTWGLGRAGQFAILNASNEQTALGGITVGTGTAVSGYTNSTKAFSGVFYTDNTQNTEACLYATTTGQGFVGQFVSGNAQPNNRSTIYAGTTGKGNAGEFIVLSNDNSMCAISAYHNNKGPAIYGKHEGTGRTASFEQMNQMNNEPTLFASAKGNGPAIYARNDGKGYAAQLNIPNTSTNNSPVLIVDNQRGRKGAVIQSSADTDEPALEVVKNGTNKQAALFTGNVQINGTLSKQAGAFIIDHPLDPANKYLSHSFVESPDMKNIYDGIVVLDENGEATVELPNWFQALNKDFRYQLTCINAYAPVYIAQEIQENKFKIAGGKKGLKVSWQVTGVRHDKYAEKYPIVVEKDKPQDQKGTYLCPDNPNSEKAGKTQNNILGVKNNYQNLNVEFNRPDSKEERIKAMLLQNDVQKPGHELINSEK